MTGISEILLLVLLIACILILPRIFKEEPVKNSSAPTSPLKRLSAKVRLGIVLSVIYPVLAAIYFEPWEKTLLPYLSYGVLPVFLIWAVAWVLAGTKK